MKKTINNIIITSLLAITLASCGENEKNTKSETNNEILQQVDTVVAIGKVSAENGTAIISSETSGIVKEILIKEGDTVNKNTYLLKLTNKLSSIEIELAQNNLQIAKDQNQLTQQDLNREIIVLSNLEQKYTTSKSLFSKQAETKENLLNDESNYKQQKIKIESLKKQLEINNAQTKEQQINLEKTKINQSDYIITAPENGIITNLNVKIGQNVNINESLGEIINIKNLIIEAEVDELFADRVKVGQQVQFVNINNKQAIGNGEVIYTSPTLVNKSILYETANEADDRRVLRIKIKPISNNNLLINAKVECQINIK